MLNFFESLINLLNFIKIDNKKKDFVFFIESKFYRNHFMDLILNLKKLGHKNIIVITLNKDDFIFFKNITNCFYINNYMLLVIFFKILNCRFMIMTLVGLGNPFQKSRFCKFYVYFFHAIASTHKIYTKTAFKNYDIILTNGEYQSKELRLAEKQFNFPKKEIINSGYFFLDNIRKVANLNIKEKRHILFAPSWNYNIKNLFDDFSIDIISTLLAKDFIVTLRPHPEHYKRSKNIIDKVNELFSDNKNFSLDKNISNLKSLEKAEIVITDNSSIVFEFILIFKRPIIYLDYQDKIHNIDAGKVSTRTIESEFKGMFGNKLDVKNLYELSSLCENLINDNNPSNDLSNSFEKKYLSNVNNSASFAANYLSNKLNLIK